MTNVGLSLAPVYSLAVTSDTIYAGLGGGGVWKFAK
jgi:hypothetical protein